MPFLAELKHQLENQLDPDSGVTFETTPYRLIVHHREDTVGSWQATREGARWHQMHEEGDDRPVTRDVCDALEVTKRALFLFVRDLKRPAP